MQPAAVPCAPHHRTGQQELNPAPAPPLIPLNAFRQPARLHARLRPRARLPALQIICPVSFRARSPSRPVSDPVSDRARLSSVPHKSSTMPLDATDALPSESRTLSGERVRAAPNGAHRRAPTPAHPQSPQRSRRAPRPAAAARIAPSAVDGVRAAAPQTAAARQCVSEQCVPPRESRHLIHSTARLTSPRTAAPNQPALASGDCRRRGPLDERASDERASAGACRGGGGGKEHSIATRVPSPAPTRAVPYTGRANTRPSLYA